MKRTTIRMPDDMHELLREVSYETRKSINTIINNAITRYLEKIKNNIDGKEAERAK